MIDRLGRDRVEVIVGAATLAFSWTLGVLVALWLIAAILLGTADLAQRIGALT